MNLRIEPEVYERFRHEYETRLYPGDYTLGRLFVRLFTVNEPCLDICYARDDEEAERLIKDRYVIKKEVEVAPTKPASAWDVE
jgi:hypothetical protein